MVVVVTTGAIRCAKLQLNRRHPQTNSQHVKGGMPFLSPQPTVSEHCKGTAACLSTVGDRAFPVAAARVCGTLCQLKSPLRRSRHSRDG